MLHLRPQTELLAGLKRLTRDTTAVTWSETEMTNAINDALTAWAGRISVPMVYAPGTAWPDNTLYVILPIYMEARNVELRMRDNDASAWVSMNMARIFTQTTTAHALQIPWVSDMQYEVLFYVENKQLPTTLPTLDAACGATDVTISVSPAVMMVAPAGWLRIDSEFVSYTGIESSATNTAFSGLGRAANYSTGASHLISTSVEFCVAANGVDSFAQLYDGALARLYELALADSSSTEQPFLERMTSFYSGRSEAYWKRFQVGRSPRWLAYAGEVPTLEGLGVVTTARES